MRRALTWDEGTATSTRAAPPTIRPRRSTPSAPRPSQNYYIDLESSQGDADAHAQRGSPGVPAEPHGRTHANRASDEGVASPVMPRKKGGPEKFSTVDDINANSRQWRKGANEILSRVS